MTPSTGKRLSVRMRELSWFVMPSADRKTWTVRNHTARVFTFKDNSWGLKYNELMAMLELEELLREFDYSYSMSDDGRIWRRGRAQEDRIWALIECLDMEPVELNMLQKLYEIPEMFRLK